MDHKKNNDFVNPALAEAIVNDDPFSWQEKLVEVIFREVANRKTSRIRVGQESYFVKIHKSFFWQGAFSDLIRGQIPSVGAEAEWRAIRALQLQDIPTIEPFLYAKRGVTFLNHRSMLISKALENKVSLEYFSTNDALFKRQLIKKIAKLTQKMHFAGINHRDFYLCHFLMDQDISNGPVLHLIDLHRAQVREKVPLRWLIKDLGSLLFSSLSKGLSRRDLLRFVREYSGKPLKEALKDKKLWVGSLARARKLYLKHHKKIPVKIGKLLQESLFVSIKVLKSSGRKIDLPFSMILHGPNSERMRFRITEVLRILPRKRLVLRGYLREESVILKIFFGPFAERRFSKEIKGLEAIKKSGVASPHILRTGVSPLGSGKVIVFRLLKESLSLEAAIESVSSSRERTALLFRMMEILARLHNFGLDQRDSHPENFLISDGKIFVIDGQQIYRQDRGYLDRSPSLKSLALFFSHIKKINESEIIESTRHYLSCRDKHFKESQNKIIFNYVKRFRQKNLKKYMKKVFRDCSEVSVNKSFFRFTAIARTHKTPTMLRLINNLDFEIDRGIKLKEGNTNTVSLIITTMGPFVVKRYNMKTILHRISRLFRRTRASRSWRYGHLLTSLRIKTPYPIALIEERFGLLRGKAYLITEYCSGYPAERLIGKKEFGKEPLFIVNLLKALFDNQLVHGDLKSQNFLIEDDSACIIDLDSTFEVRKTKNHRIHIRKEIARFFKNWENHPKLRNTFLHHLKSMDLLD
ncbi:MAG: lipopolysaccharide core heptose(I) kinase RfaP [Pseudomonadota bacterium]|nr:lipopolysaccharide core heptose(I) kinase RfaP [Pseudomonadota bacterium]